MGRSSKNTFTGIKYSAKRVTTKEMKEYLNPHYCGQMAVFENGRRLWGFTSGIYRLSKEDALYDAKKLGEDYIKKEA